MIIKINSVMKALVLSALVLFMNSCASERVEGKEGLGNLVQVDVVDNRNGNKDNVKTGKEGFKDMFLKKKKWMKMSDDTSKVYRDKTLIQLEKLMVGASPQKVTLVLDALGRRGASAVKYIAPSLKDEREAVFSESEAVFWYEQKNKPAEPMEIRIFAALQLEKILSVNPSGLMFNFHKIQTSDRGAVEVLYAIRGDYAVGKEDVSKVWLSWWSRFRTDFE